MPDLDLQATLTWLAVRAAADVAERGRAARDGDAVLLALQTGDRHLDRVHALVDSPRIREALSPMRRRAAAYLALATAEGTRLHDRPEPGAWSAAVAASDGLAMALRTIYARIRQAEACLAMGRETRSAAISLLVDAHQRAWACGSRSLVEMSEGIARRARIVLGDGGPPTGTIPPDRAPAPVDPAHGYGLTPREVEILGLLAIGLTNRQIGERLFISPKTAGVHVSNILGKLELDSRIQAATLAHRLGIATVVSD
jgi:DNA-binding NarL/FixJ family response regulator